MAFESEVLVIGAGLAGLSCALHLQNQGVEVTIPEVWEVIPEVKNIKTSTFLKN